MPLLALAGGLPWRMIAIVGGVIALLGIAGIVAGSLKRAGMYQAQRDTALAAAAANADVVKWQAEDQEAREAIALATAKDKTAIRGASDSRRKAINDAPPSDDGPLAPVLRRQLDSLRGPEGAGARGATASAAGAGGISDPH